MFNIRFESFFDKVIKFKSFISKFNDLVFGPEDDDEVDFAANSEPSFDFDQPPVQPATTKKP